MPTLQRVFGLALRRATSASHHLPRAIMPLDERESIPHAHTCARRETGVVGGAIGQAPLLDKHDRLRQRVESTAASARYPAIRTLRLGGHKTRRREKCQYHLVRI